MVPVRCLTLLIICVLASNIFIPSSSNASYKFQRVSKRYNKNKRMPRTLHDEKGLSKDIIERQFPLRKFIKTEISEIERRSRITDSIKNFNEDSDGALIVIDADNRDDENVNKKSRVTNKQNNFDGGQGISILLNNNGMEDNEKKKDQIYKEIQENYNKMDDDFGSIINNPPKHKRVRVILITPIQNAQTGHERDYLPEPDNLDQLAELDRNNLVLSENDGTDNVRFLSDFPRKSELEIDIDKLKHVKEKLKLLNEDGDNIFDAKPTLIFRNLTNLNKSNSLDIEAGNLSLTNNLTAKTDFQPEINQFNSRNKDLERGQRQETPIIFNVNQTTFSEKLGLHDSGDGKDNDQTEYDGFIHEEKKKERQDKNDNEGKIHENLNMDHEVNFMQLKTKNISNIAMSNLNNVKNQSANKIADDTEDDNNRKHQISKYGKKLETNTDRDEMQLKSLNKFVINARESAHEGKMKPPGNPSPDDVQDLMKELKTTMNENPTKSSNIRHTEQDDLTKKENPAKLKTKTVTEDLSLPHSESSKDDTSAEKEVYSRKISKLKQSESRERENKTMTAQFHLASSLRENENKMTKNIEQKKKFENKGLSIDQKIAKSKTKSAKTENTQTSVPNLEKTPSKKVIDKRKAEAIIEFMNRDPLESWRYHFNTLKSLDLNSSILRSGLVNAGNIERLKGVMRRALEGKDITLSIVGGSISAGGGLYKDRGNIDGLYYKGVVDWWNKMISPLTGSDMLVNNIAIGSIGTDYFSYCIKNHIANDSDIVLWELSANDYNRYKMQPTKGARPLERLTRMILELSNKPALLYVNFFKGIDYKATRESCPNFEDQGEDTIAHYYKIPSLSWRSMVCEGLIRRDMGYNLDTLFSQDQYHPSLRGHAQMSLLLLLHLRHVMRAVLQWAIEHDGNIDRYEDQFVIPEPLFIGPKYPEPLCWTLITSDLSERITNSLQVRVTKDSGFKLEYATNFPIRFDKVICWKAEIPLAELSIQFYIPEMYGRSNIKRNHSEIAITTHTRWGGSSTLWLDDRTDKPIIIKEGRPNDPGKRTQVDTIADDVPPGMHTLNVRSHDGGFCLSAIMIDGS